MSLSSMIVLFVEDDLYTQENIKMILEDEVKELHIASNGEEGLKFHKSINPDIVIADECMPILSGLDMIKKIQKFNPNQSTVLFTALSDTKTLSKAINLNIDKLVLKPLEDFEIFLSKLKEIAKKINIQRELERQKFQLEEQNKIIDRYVLSSVSDLNGNVVDISSAFLELSGFTKKEVIGKNHSIFRAKEYSKEVFEEFWEVLKAGKQWKGELKNLTKEGKVYWIKTVIAPLFDKNGEKIGYKSIKVDITDKKYIESLSEHDSLTGLYNRRKIEEYLTKYKEKVDRYDIDCSVVMIDIDDFKLINDQMGHIVGDKILEEFSNLMRNNLRKIDIVARWGGEEFLLLLPHIDLEQGFELAEKLRQSVESNMFTNNIKVSSSFGISKLTSSKTVMQTIDEADRAMYQSKENGKNRVSIFDEKNFSS